GYSWDGIEENKVYNPFSIVNFFQSFKFENYWFETGTPTVLVRGARKQQITLDEMERVYASGKLLKSANLTQFYSLSLLFQSGYLTIKEVLGDDDYVLGFPNQEVRDSYASYLLAEYVGKDWQETEYTIAYKLRKNLQDEKLAEAFQIFAPVISSTGYDITKHTEGFFHTIMHVLMYSTGLVTFSELQNAEGRLDTICIAQKAVYLFEFKINSSAETALKQIKKQQYFEQFLPTTEGNETKGRSLYLVGINFSVKSKKITQIEVEKWNGNEFERLKGKFVPKQS
ncbi:MAG: PD-(D/E)XK nuclease domain-containing protein, partial [Bacteroidia bacterium]